MTTRPRRISSAAANHENNPMRTTLQKETRPSAEPGRAPLQFVTPVADIFETGEAFILTAEMPGVSKSDLEVTLEGQELTIVGHRRSEVPAAELLFRESQRADFRRAFELDPSIDSAKIGAQMEQGVLTLRLPKAERVKPRRIEIAP